MLKSKVKKKLPTLKFLGQVKRKNLTELFEPVKTLNFEDDEEEGDKDDSPKNEWTGKYGERFRKIYIENKKIAGKFTSDYKSTLSEVKNEMFPVKKISPLISESIEDLTQVIKDSRRNKLDNVSSIQVHDPIDMTDYYVNEEEVEQEDSTTWILLQAACTEENYANSSEECIHVLSKEENMLNRPEIEWKVLNESIIKCQNWLDALDIHNLKCLGET